MTDNPDSLAPDALIAGRYRVVGLLGKGGTGTVYEVDDARSGKRLALKLLQSRRSALGSLSAVLFEREYHTLRQLAHPRIIEVFDHGLEAGRAFYTMELLDGIDLQSLGVLPWQRACALLCDVASSLAIVHSRRLVHRDVSARNVRCTSDGHAKLLDFGAMVPMGIARHIVGTPPYLSPEAIDLQGLDGRADLYSLGALAYFLLTGYHAYEARNVDALRAIWSCPPMLPSQLTPGIPLALDRLVMELLQLDRNARPSSAAEVMERLSGIAGLPLLELPAVTRSYLITPSLVGREGLLRGVSETLSTTVESGQGAGLCIEGEPGMGRSRVLDACVLEARLLGMLVLRGDAGDSAERGEYGLLKALCEQLFEAYPDVCERVAERRGPALRWLLPGHDASSQHTRPPTRPSLLPRPAADERLLLLRAAQELLLAAARSQPLLIAVDDIDAIDEPSAALLGMLAQVIKQRPLVLVTTSAGAASGGPALALLRETAGVARLEALDAEQSEALLRSVFGDVAHLVPLAATVFEIAEGNPRATMTLAADLIEHGLARYEAGSWSLPAELHARDLPSSASAALLGRLARLSADARELAEVFALSEPSTLPLELLPALCAHDDRARAYDAFDELLSASVLERVGERCRFSQRALSDALERDMPEARTRAVHARLARALEGDTFDLTVVRHQLLGGQEHAAIERLCQICNENPVIYAEAFPLLQLALQMADRAKVGLQRKLELLVYVVRVAARAGRRDVVVAYAPALLSQYQRDSGLLDHQELPQQFQGAARVQEALRRAELRRNAAPECERALPLDEVAERLTHVHSACSMMAAAAQELALLAPLARLDPFFERFPSWQATQGNIDICRCMQEGRTTQAMQRAAELMQWLQGPGQRTLHAETRNELRRSGQSLLAMFAATGGQAAVGSLIAEFEQVPGYRASAWRIRMVYELMHGNLTAAANCQRQSDLCNLQDSGKTVSPGYTVRIELIAHMYAENLLGVKHAMERIATLAAQYPGWQPTLAIARCHYRCLQGDALGGLAELEPALSTQAGRHIDWWLLAYTHIKVLCELDRRADAAAFGERYVQIFDTEQLSSVDYGLRQATAEALAGVGRLDEARAMIERYIAMHERLGTRGLRLGLAYETAARVAMAAGDEFAVGRYTALCAEEYKGGRDLLLKAKLERLLRETEEYGARMSAAPAPVV